MCRSRRSRLPRTAPLPPPATRNPAHARPRVTSRGKASHPRPRLQQALPAAAPRLSAAAVRPAGGPAAHAASEPQSPKSVGALGIFRGIRSAVESIAIDVYHHSSKRYAGEMGMHMCQRDEDRVRPRSPRSWKALATARDAAGRQESEEKGSDASPSASGSKGAQEQGMDDTAQGLRRRRSRSRVGAHDHPDEASRRRPVNDHRPTAAVSSTSPRGTA